MTTIPQSTDGSRFTADLVLPDGTYQIGPKGSEYRVHGYQAALHELRTMNAPRWRRPNATTGKRGIVTGINWINA